MPPEIKPPGQGPVQSTRVDSQPAEEKKQTTEAKQESKSESPPLSDDQKEKLKQTRYSESKFAEVAMRAKTEEFKMPETTIKAPAPETKKIESTEPAPAAVPAADPERLKKIETILEKSPTGKEMLKKAKDKGVEFQTGPAGDGSYTVNKKKIVVDRNETAESAALTYAHEIHHAVTPPVDPTKVKREDYIKSKVKEEVDGTCVSIEVNNELKAAGVDTKGATFPLQGKYNEAKSKAIEEAKKKDPKMSKDDLEKIGREAGRKKVEEGFMNGEVVTSIKDSTGRKLPYVEYYGKAWDDAQPKPAK